MNNCFICGLNTTSGAGGWSSMHFNFSDMWNLNVYINRGEIFHLLDKIEKHIKESEWVDYNEQKIKSLLFCIYIKLKGIDINVANKFYEIYKEKIDEGYNWALENIYDKASSMDWHKKVIKSVYEEKDRTLYLPSIIP